MHNGLKQGLKLAAVGGVAAFVAHEYYRNFTPLRNICTRKKLIMRDAILENKSEDIEAILKTNPAALKEEYFIGGMGGACLDATPLDFAIFNGRRKATVALLENGAKIDDLNWYSRSDAPNQLLSWAIGSGSPNFVRAVIKQKPDFITKVDENGNNVLVKAIPSEYKFFRSIEKMPVMMALIELGVDPNHKNVQGESFYSMLNKEGLPHIRMLLTSSQKLNDSSSRLRPTT